MLYAVPHFEKVLKIHVIIAEKMKGPAIDYSTILNLGFYFLLSF